MKKESKKNKKGSNVINILRINVKNITWALVGLAVGILIMSIMWPERIASLKNGEEVILEIKGHTFTADDLYKELKVSNANETLFNMVDLAILKDKYPDIESEASEFASNQSTTIYTTYQTYYGYTKEDFLSSNGFNTEDDFLTYLKEQYYYQKYYDEYVESIITEKEIKKYYKESVFGEKAVYIFSSTENENDLEKIRSGLKDKKTFNELKEKYSSVTAQSYDAVTYKDTSTFSQTVLNKIAQTSKGKYSEVFTDANLGNVVVYAVSEKEKDKLEDIKDEIIDILVKDKQETDDKLYYQAFIQLRKDFDLDIKDTELKDFYEASIKQYK